MLPEAEWLSTKEESVINGEKLEIKGSDPAVSTSRSINMVQ